MRRLFNYRKQVQRFPARRCQPTRPLHLNVEQLEERNLLSRVLLWVAQDPTYPSGGGGGGGSNVIIGGALAPAPAVNGHGSGQVPAAAAKKAPAAGPITPNDSTPTYYADSDGVGNWYVLSAAVGDPAPGPTGLTNFVDPGDALIFDPDVSGGIYQGANVPCELNMQGTVGPLGGSTADAFQLGQLYIDASYTQGINADCPLLLSNPGGRFQTAFGNGAAFDMQNGVLTGAPISIDGATPTIDGTQYHTTGYWYYGTIATSVFNVGDEVEDPLYGNYTYYGGAQFYIETLPSSPGTNHILVATTFSNISTTTWGAGEVTLDQASVLSTADYYSAVFWMTGSADYVYADSNQDSVVNSTGTLDYNAANTHVQAPFTNAGTFNLVHTIEFDAGAFQTAGITNTTPPGWGATGTIFMNGTGTNGGTYVVQQGVISGQGKVQGNLSLATSESNATLSPGPTGVFTITGNLTLYSPSFIVINVPSSTATTVPSVWIEGQVYGTPGTLQVNMGSNWNPGTTLQLPLVVWSTAYNDYPWFTTGVTGTLVTYSASFKPLATPTAMTEWALEITNPGGGGGHQNVIIANPLQPVRGLVTGLPAPASPVLAAPSMSASLGSMLASSDAQADLLRKAVLPGTMAPLDPAVIDALMSEQKSPD